MAETAGIADRVRTVAQPYVACEGAGLPMLHAVQAEFGCVPAEAVPVLAELLNRSRAEIHGLISFYHDFHDHPRRGVVVKLCRAEACQSMGGARLAADVQAALGIGWGGTTADGRVTLEPVYCLGLCAAAPCGMVDGRPLARLNREKIGALVAGAAR